MIMIHHWMKHQVSLKEMEQVDSMISFEIGLDMSTADPNLSLSLSQLASKVNHRHRRSSSSSLSKKKRGRPR